MSASDFQFYQGPATDSADVAKITVRRGGVLVLTQAAVAMLGDGVERVQVGYNPKTRAVGLRGAAKDNQGAYRLRQQANSVSRLVDGKRVFAHHGLMVGKAQSFDAQDFGDGVVGIVLPESDEPAAAAKAKPKAGKK